MNSMGESMAWMHCLGSELHLPHPTSGPEALYGFLKSRCCSCVSRFGLDDVYVCTFKTKSIPHKAINVFPDLIFRSRYLFGTLNERVFCQRVCDECSRPPIRLDKFA